MKSVLLCAAGVLVSCLAASSQDRQAVSVYSDPATLAAELRGLSDALGKTGAAKLNLPEAWQVQTSQGSFSISTRPLKELLEKGAPIQEPQGWLDYLAMHLSAFSSAAPIRAANSRVILNSILARREFAGNGPPSAWELDAVYRIIRSHRGNVSFESRPGETRFVVRIPLARPGRERARERA